MRSRIDIYANDRSNTYEWDVYSASDVKSYQWDKYNFHYDYKYKWNVYPTVENAEDRYFYWEYGNKISNNMFVSFGDVQNPARCIVNVWYNANENTAWVYSYEVPFSVLYQQYKLDNRKLTNIISREWLRTNGTEKVDKEVGNGKYTTGYAYGKIKFEYDNYVCVLGGRNPNGIIPVEDYWMDPYFDHFYNENGEEVEEHYLGPTGFPNRKYHSNSYSSFESAKSGLEEAKRNQWWREDIIKDFTGLRYNKYPYYKERDTTYYYYNLGWNGKDIDYVIAKYGGGNNYYIIPKVPLNILPFYQSTFPEMEKYEYDGKELFLSFNTFNNGEYGWLDYESLYRDDYSDKPMDHINSRFSDGNMELMSILDCIRNYTVISTVNGPTQYLKYPSSEISVGPIYGWDIDKDKKTVVGAGTTQSVYPNAPYDYIGIVPKGAIVPYVPYYDIDYTRKNGHIVITGMEEKKDKLIYELYLGLNWEDTYPEDKVISYTDYYPPRVAYSANENAYPVSDFSYGRYTKYTFVKDKELDVGYVADITSKDLETQTASDNVYYIYRGLVETTPVKDDFVESVSSYNKNQYPAVEGVQDGYLYVYTGEMINRYVRGAVALKKVYSGNKNTYPLNGLVLGDPPYWYVYRGIRQIVVRSYEPSELLDVRYSQSIGSENSFAIGVVGGASVSFDILKPYADVIQYKGFNCDVYFDYQNNSKYYKAGRFTIKEVKENGFNKTTAIAYDNCAKLDALVEPLINAISSKTNMVKLYMYICNYCDIPFDPLVSFVNQEYEMGDITIENDATCRDIMTWIAQIGGCVMVCDSDGYMVMKDITAPTNSRGSGIAENYDLEVSMIPIIKPEGIRFKGTYQDKEITVNLVQQSELPESKLLDFTNNRIIASHVDSESVKYMNTVLARIKNMGDVYAWNCKLDNNFYNMVCGDSWVVTAQGITPRRGIIADINIDATGVTMVSSAGIESDDVAANGKTDADLRNSIQEVDNMFKNITINGIKVVDSVYHEVQEEVKDLHTFTIGDTVYNANNFLFDIKNQFDSFYFHDKDVELVVNGKIMVANIDENGYLVLVDSNEDITSVVKVEDVYYYTNNTLNGKASEWIENWETEKKQYPKGEYITDYGISDNWYTFIWVQGKWENHTYKGPYVADLIAKIIDGKTYTTTRDENDFATYFLDDFEIVVEGERPLNLRFRYDVSTRILHVTRLGLPFNKTVTINSITLTDGTVLTPEGESLPLTVNHSGAAFFGQNSTTWWKYLQNNGVRYGSLDYTVYTNDGETVTEKWGYGDGRELSHGKYQTLSTTNTNGDIVIDLFPTCIVDSVKVNNLDTLNDTLTAYWVINASSGVPAISYPKDPHKINAEFRYNEGFTYLLYLKDSSDRNVAGLTMSKGQWVVNVASGAVDTVSFDRTNGVLTITTK